MVFHAANNNGLAIQFGENAAEVMVQFIAKRFVAQEGPPVFGGENGVNQDFREGLSHRGRMRERCI